MKGNPYSFNKKHKSLSQTVLQSILVSILTLGLVSVPFYLKYNVFASSSDGTAGQIFPVTPSDEDDAEDDDSNQSVSISANLSESPTPLLDKDQYYYRSQLNDEDQKVYDRLVDALYSFEQHFTLNNISEFKITDIYFNSVLQDHPEIFWSTSFSTSTTTPTAKTGTFTVYPIYTHSEQEVLEIQKEINQTVQKAKNEFGTPSSEYDLVKKVYEFIADNVEYDLNSPDNQVIISSMVNGVSVCAGYSKMMTYLLQSYGMSAFCVQGDVFPIGAHQWNIVMIDGEYYQCDPTWGDGAINNNGSGTTSFINYDYLCTDDEFIMEARTYSKTNQMPPACSSKRFMN